jgi:hypothetical protein
MRITDAGVKRSECDERREGRCVRGALLTLGNAPRAALFVAETEMAWIRGFGLYPACVTEAECGSSSGEHDRDQNKTPALAHCRLRQYQAEQCAERPCDGL